MVVIIRSPLQSCKSHLSSHSRLKDLPASQKHVVLIHRPLVMEQLEE